MSDMLVGAGIQMICPEREGFAGYHAWLLERAPQEMFFAGHSVLHRVQLDFTECDFKPVEVALVKKLKENSKVKVIFLDPLWDYIDSIAAAEDEDPMDLRTNLAISLGICRRPWHGLEEAKLPGTLDIRACQEYEQYAFHHVACREKGEEKMFIGFYFAERIGMKTPLFAVENERIREEFTSHFNAVFARATNVLHYPTGGTNSQFNQGYFEKCQRSLAERLGHEKLNTLLSGDAQA